MRDFQVGDIVTVDNHFVLLVERSLLGFYFVPVYGPPLRDFATLNWIKRVPSRFRLTSKFFTDMLAAARRQYPDLEVRFNQELQ